MERIEVQMKNDKKNGEILYFDKKETKTINKKRLIGFIILFILLLSIIILYIVYAENENFRNYLDENVLRKDIEGNNLKSITIEDYDKSNIFAFSNYIAILKNNTLEIYSSSAKREADIRVEISNPITYNNGKYLLLAEQNSSKAYLIADNVIKWEKDLEGNISRVCVNENGYSSIILSGTAYKSVIILLDDKGNELFRTYLSSTIAIDASISNDNKYLSFAEINTSGTMIQSNIKTISIEKAKEKPTESIIYTYNAPSNSLILNIKYQNNSRLICMYDDSIHVIKDNTDKKITDINTKDEKITFSSIELNNFAVKNIEENEGLLKTMTTVKIINTTSQKESTYKFEGVTKELYCSGNKVALNLGSEVHFIDTNGWLIKKYTSSKEIRGLVLTNDIAGIIYRDKIEILKF